MNQQTMMQPTYRPNSMGPNSMGPNSMGPPPGQIQYQPTPVITPSKPPPVIPVINPSESLTDVSVKATLSSAIKGVMDCDAKLKHLNVAIAQLRQERAIHGEIILKFMDSKKIQELQTQSGTKIACCSTQPFKPLNKKDITDIISNYPGLSPAQSKDIANFLIEHRVRAKPSRKIVQKTPTVKEKDGKESDSLLSVV
jgi:hypothetical protein